ncbi:MAG: hypothetical protein ACYTG5_06895 [Planctomycetota bacterium]|jgi:hypothetical protein
MAEAGSQRWRPTRTNLIATGVILGGLALMELSWWFMILVGLGIFGPGLLREFGWLRDKDEFQRRADHRAGYHAFLAAGLLATLLIAWIRSGEREIKDPQELGTLFFALLCFVWIFSALLSFWGVKKTTARILIGFGLGWLIFTIVSNLGQEWSGWSALLMHPLLTLPFFALAWMAGRMPRISGMLLLGAAGFFVYLFRFFQRDHIGLVTDGVTFIFFVGPLLASGVALLAVRGEDEGDEME